MRFPILRVTGQWFAWLMMDRKVAGMIEIPEN
jgi:hypothetical protein